MSNLPIENEYLPANHQDAGNEPRELVVESESEYAEIVDLDALSLEELGMLHEKYDHDIDHLDAGRVEIRKAIFDKMETDSEEAGNYVASKVKKYKFVDLTPEKADELGLAKKTLTVDTTKAKAAYLNGVDVGEVQIDTILAMRKKKEVESNE